MSELLDKTPRKIADAFVETEVDDEAVIMQVDKGFFFTLNVTSEAIWSAIDGTASIKGIVESVAPQFGATPDECRSDIEEFLSKLSEHGLVELV